MKKRSIGKMLLLTIVTLGIYRLYWFIKTRSEMKSIANVDIPSPWLLLAPIAAYIIGFLSLILSSLANDSGAGVIGILFFYAMLFASFIIYALWLWRYSKAVEIVTKEKLGFAISLLILLAVPDGIDILIIQDYFNKIAIDKSATPQEAPVAS